jgi:hypothetical protein
MLAGSTGMSSMSSLNIGLNFRPTTLLSGRLGGPQREVRPGSLAESGT